MEVKMKAISRGGKNKLVTAITGLSKYVKEMKHL